MFNRSILKSCGFLVWSAINLMKLSQKQDEEVCSAYEICNYLSTIKCGLQIFNGMKFHTLLVTGNQNLNV